MTATRSSPEEKEIGKEPNRPTRAEVLAAAGRTVPDVIAPGLRAAFGRPRALVGPQPERLGPARLWLLPQPSGLNANHQMPALTAAFQELHEACGKYSVDERLARAAKASSTPSKSTC